MEDATPEVDVPATATRTFQLQPFSWVSPSTFGPLHAIFPGIPFTRPRVAAFIDYSVPLFQHRTRTDPYGVDTTISEEARIQQVAPLQDITWPFVLDGPTFRPRWKKDYQKNHNLSMQSTLPHLG